MKERKEKYVQFRQQFSVGDWILFSNGTKAKIVKIVQEGTVWVIYGKHKQEKKIMLAAPFFDTSQMIF